MPSVSRRRRCASKIFLWPSLRDETQLKGKLLYFLCNPKPWDLSNGLVHPHYHFWPSVLGKTAMKSFRFWYPTPSHYFPKTRKAWIGYKKRLKKGCYLPDIHAVGSTELRVWLWIESSRVILALTDGIVFRKKPSIHLQCIHQQNQTF